MNFSIYVPEELGERVKAAKLEVSKVCQEALTKAVEGWERVKATGGKMNAIEVEVGTAKGLLTKRFTGRWIVLPPYKSPKSTSGDRWGIAISQTGKIVVFRGEKDQPGGALLICNSLQEAEERFHVPSELVQKVLDEIGPIRIGVVEDLDI